MRVSGEHRAPARTRGAGTLPAAINSGSLTLARAVVGGQLPGWFRLHAATMDSALAAHDRQFSAAGNGPVDG